MTLERRRFELPCGTFHALTGGDPAGRPLLYLHGFPDHPPTARPFLGELCRRGHNVLALWLRGYAPSPIAGPFDPDTVVGDVIALIDRWSPGRAVDIVGHDWGALHTYLACITAPERVRRAVTLAVPHPLGFIHQLRKPSQLRRSWYWALFQLPGSGWVATGRNLALVDLFWRLWSPGFSLDAERRAELRWCLASSLPAPIMYYRAMLRPSAVRVLRRLSRPIATPLLQLHGADDGCVLPPTLDDRDRFTGAHALEVVPDVGHFLHIEKPGAIGARVAAWLA